MKSLIIIICIISIAFGYIIGKFSFSSFIETRTTSEIETRYDRSKSHDTRIRNNGDNASLNSILGGRSISDVPAADLAAILIKLSKPDPNADDFSSAKQTYQLQFLLSKLSATDLAKIATELSSNPETKNSDGMTKIISALAAKDPDRALDWISTQEDSSKLYPLIISSIAKNNPQTASSLFRSAIIDGKISNINLRSIASDISNSTAKLGADPFFGFLDSLPKGLQNGLIYDAVSKIPENDSIKFLDHLHQRIQDGQLVDHYMDYAFSRAISKNMEAAREWLKKLPENAQKNNFRTEAAKQLYLSGDTESGIEWMKEAIAASPGREKEIMHILIHNLHLNKPEGIPVFANLLPEGAKFTAKDIIYPNNYGSEAIPNLASAISDPDEKSIFIADSIKKISEPINGKAPRVHSGDLDILSRQIAAMGFTGQNADRVNDAIETAKNQLSLKN